MNTNFAQSIVLGGRIDTDEDEFRFNNCLLDISRKK